MGAILLVLAAAVGDQDGTAAPSRPEGKANLRLLIGFQLAGGNCASRQVRLEY
jgi:hypothetical protein